MSVFKIKNITTWERATAYLSNGDVKEFLELHSLDGWAPVLQHPSTLPRHKKHKESTFSDTHTKLIIERRIK